MAISTGTLLNAQKKSAGKNLVYVDKQGVLRFTSDNKEAVFFGVNYTTPFAHAYRAHKVLNADIEKAIQQDVYHMSRLGLDAFRVHVWDTEISDTLGNLLENDHLRLFDFLLAELKKRNIKTIITPIAFWGNGYPERDEATPGFSRRYGKGRATVNDTAIRAQERYMVQFFKHKNPYTNLTYTEDTDVIACELNNEPNHNGPKEGVTNYINRIAAAVRSTGFTKPIYYNVSQTTFYAEAFGKANIDGVSFQWYPTGLVANQENKGNFLPNVDSYNIRPYDSISSYNNKSLIVYEFDAADVLQSSIYPAVARSFKEAGFQWVTQFAYDPMAMAHTNTEYQTHYLNLVYTPSKAISILIASEAFHKLPRKKNYGTYPADSLFDVFRVSYRNNLSEMNTEQKFLYSNTTATKPVNAAKLKTIAGVGSSIVVNYSGTGTYFLDKVEEGVWRLEVMPDAVHVRDPFERASPSKEVTRVVWQNNSMQITLPDLGSGFGIKGLNSGNNFSGTALSENFQIQPGTYLLTRTGKNISVGKNSVGVIGLNEFVAPQPVFTNMFLRHEPFAEVSAGKSFTISAKVVGIDTGRVTLQISRFGGRGQGGGPRTILMTKKAGSEYTAEVPADLLTTGMLNYRILLQKGNEFAVFPGNFTTHPFAWDTYTNETWKTFVVAENGRLEIFNPTADRAFIYPGFRRGFQSSYITGEKPGQLLLKINTTELSGDHTIGFQWFFADKLKGRTSEASSFDKLIVRARTTENRPVQAKVILTNADATSVSTFITLTNSFQDIEVPLNNLFADSALLLPRPYPPYLPLKFKGNGSVAGFKLSDAEKIEITIGSELLPIEFTKPYSMEVETIWIQKKK
ncbi:MAG: membrane or secreted protein [Ferruginibacter sp.]|nr:membrane or secreted protein [Ferruginibacter sp.]